MSDRIFYIQSNLSAVPWESRAAAAVPSTSPPTPAYYHVLYRGCGETQVGWHGETYCLVGGYRLYGDVPLATPPKAKAEKPAEKPAQKPAQKPTQKPAQKPTQRAREAPKKRRAPTEAEKSLGCPSPKICTKRPMSKKLAG
ncbi:DPEP2 neighbor protein [Marmota marmota marmota]|uniref:DPEP2 neighbor protein n=1 Tax=Marmota marmota marmota TaxID=9994 RepID=UPI00209304FF|nr:DPEP2 neighbor protein [Marmota marmota marmota]